MPILKLVQESEASEQVREIPMTHYGRVGLDVGPIGRWSRLVMMAALLAPIIIDLSQDFDISRSPSFLGVSALYLVGIAAVYTTVYYLLGDRLLARANPWLNTLIFVGPAWVIAWWNIAIAPATGLSLPSALGLAMIVYVGISLLLQWKIKYGGCEVVSLPIILFKRRYVTYCIPLVAVDATEKELVTARLNWQKVLWGGILASLLGALLALILTELL
jgi:hypothetical protein